MNNFFEHVSFIWSIAEILRGNYKQSEYGKVVLPFTVLRRHLNGSQYSPVAGGAYHGQ